MAIRTLSLQEFDRFRSARTILARRLTDKAVEWFVDETGGVLGAIAYDEHALDWSFVILGRDLQGKFCAFDRDIGTDGLENTRRLLVEKMAVAASLVEEVLLHRPVT
jgi:hypothetical protein